MHKLRNRMIGLVLVCGLMVCGWGGKPSLQPVAAEARNSYDVQAFLEQTCFREVAVSPNGRHVVVATVKDNFTKDAEEVALWKIDLEADGTRKEIRRLTSEDASYSNLQWSADGRFLACLSTRKPAAGQQLFVFDMKGGEPQLVSESKNGVGDYEWLPDGSGIVFCSRQSEGARREQQLRDFYGDVQRYSPQQFQTTFYRIASKDFSQPSAKELASVEALVSEFALAPEGKRVACVTTGSDTFGTLGWQETEVFLLSLEGKSKARQVTKNFVLEGSLKWGADGALYATTIGDFTAKRTTYTQPRLVKIALTDGQLEFVTSDFSGGVMEFTPLPNQKLLVCGALSTAVNLYQVMPNLHQTSSVSSTRGKISLVSTSKDGQTTAFVRADQTSFQELFVMQGLEKRSAPVQMTEFNADLKQIPMPETQVISWPNGEGDTIEGVLYWPPGKRGNKNLPLVVDIHGGPWSLRTESITLDTSSALYYPALLASSGYLVLEPNYRGGIGQGDKFLNALEGYSCSRPAADVMTGVDFLVSSGWADSNRLGVMGYSYGGLMTNCLVTRTNRFKVACSGAGIWNDISYFGTADNFIQNDVRNLGKAPWEDLKNYWEESAASKAAAIRTPTLIVAGGADRRVPLGQSQELYRTLVRLGVPAELLVFPGEGHLFRKPSHKKTKIRAEMAWLNHYLLDEPFPTDKQE
ncbi:MAG: S9 family peptidase [Blastocatellia bacterium]|nr:S9 family peptidase [Blastocatellia bacterium]